MGLDQTETIVDVLTMVLNEADRLLEFYESILQADTSPKSLVRKQVRDRLFFLVVRGMMAKQITR